MDSIKYYTLKIRGNSAQKQKDGHVLVYNKDGDYYYDVSLGDLFARFDVEIASIKEEQDTVNKQQNENIEALRKEIADFKNHMTSQYNNLLANYKKLAKELISLVETTNKEEE